MPAAQSTPMTVSARSLACRVTRAMTSGGAQGEARGHGQHGQAEEKGQTDAAVRGVGDAAGDEHDAG